MKKIIIVLVLGVLVLTGCGEKKAQEKIDYSKYVFTDIHWTRDGGQDTEYITFYSDGTFSYSCACGNPVNDADLCEKYTYDDKTKEIKLECFETTNETITEIKVVSASKDKLELDFDGDIRIFEVEE